MKPLEPYALLTDLQSIDKDILGINHIAEPGYAAFAVMQIATRSLVYNLNKLTDNIRELVGELDFSIRQDAGRPSLGLGITATNTTQASGKGRKGD